MWKASSIVRPKASAPREKSRTNRRFQNSLRAQDHLQEARQPTSPTKVRREEFSGRTVSAHFALKRLMEHRRPALQSVVSCKLGPPPFSASNRGRQGLTFKKLDVLFALTQRASRIGTIPFAGQTW